MAQKFDHIDPALDQDPEKHIQLPEGNVGTNINITLMEELCVQVSNYPEMFKYVCGFKKAASILTLQEVIRLSNALYKDSELYIEAISFLDTLSMLDIMAFGGNGSGITDLYMRAISVNRVKSVHNEFLSTPKKTKTLGKVKLEINNDKDMLEHINANRILLGVYIFAVIVFYFDLEVTYKNGDEKDE